MLLVIDVGNTNTVLGIYEGRNLIRDWRIRTERNTTEDELNVLLSSLLTTGGIERTRIEKSVISCVVPPVVKILDAFCRRYLGHAPCWVDARSAGMMPIRYHNPAEIGADRLVNAIAAYHKYRCSLIAIDFGTATTFDVISEKGDYLGGAISPGIMISAEALFRNASKLPRVEIFTPPETAIGKDTNTSIQAGIIFGYAAMVDGMVRRIKTEMTTTPRVIATGGLAELMFEVAETIEAIEKNLTLEGLRLLSEAL